MQLSGGIRKSMLLALRRHAVFKGLAVSSQHLLQFSLDRMPVLLQSSRQLFHSRVVRLGQSLIDQQIASVGIFDINHVRDEIDDLMQQVQTKRGCYSCFKNLRLECLYFILEPRVFLAKRLQIFPRILLAGRFRIIVTGGHGTVLRVRCFSIDNQGHMPCCSPYRLTAPGGFGHA